MKRIINILMFLIIAFFVFGTFNFYSSSFNLDKKDYNRSNKNKILKEKISELPVLENDTSNVIEFNNSLESEIKSDKKRSFWNLLKNK